MLLSLNSRRRSRHEVHLLLEALEDRWQPAAFSVTTSADSGVGSLRQAILDANANVNATPDLITFAPQLFGQTIIATSAALPTITDPVTIQGLGQNNLFISGGGQFRVLNITSSNVTITDLTILNGLAPFGTPAGGISSTGNSLVLNNVTVTQCAGGIGGGLNLKSATITNCAIVSNTANEGGAGFNDSGSVTVDNSTIAYNSDTTGYGGGGISCGFGTTLVVTRSSIIGNSSTDGGGAVIIGGSTLFPSSAQFTNCTIANNVNTVGLNNDPGGAMWLVGGGPVTITNCTIAGNVDLSTNAAAAGGISAAGTGTVVTVANSIIAQNSTTASHSPDVNGTFVSKGGNVVTSTTGASGFGSSDFTNTSAKGAPLGPLQNNGGPTLTRMPLPGNPAIEGVPSNSTVALPPTDQRGFLRKTNLNADSGAVEWQSPGTTTTLATVSPNVLVFGQPFNVSATVSPISAGPNNSLTGSVTFYNGSTALGTAPLSGGSASLTVSAAQLGTVSLYAVYSGDTLYATSASSAQTLSVFSRQTVGAFDPGSATFYLRSSNSGGPPDVGVVQFGAPGWKGLVGDWDGDGMDTIGVFDPASATFYLRNSNSAGPPSINPFQFGADNWIPLAGDWNGDGVVTIGVFDPSTATFYLRNSNTSGPADATFQFGAPGWIPVVGDWNGDGKDTVGVFDPGSANWYLRNTNASGTADIGPFSFGNTGWKPVVGDWNADSKTTVGVFDPNGNWYLRNSNSAGAPDIGPFGFGAGSWTPLAGNYTFPAPPELALGGANRAAPVTAALTDDQLQSVFQGALARLRTAGISAALVNRLAQTKLEITTLPQGWLGATFASAGRILIDKTADGYGWFVDATPTQDQEFTSNGNARPGTAAAGRMDLLTVVLHELGNEVGQTDLDYAFAGDYLMSDALMPGHRRDGALAQIFAGA